MSSINLVIMSSVAQEFHEICPLLGWLSSELPFVKLVDGIASRINLGHLINSDFLGKKTLRPAAPGNRDTNQRWRTWEEKELHIITVVVCPGIYKSHRLKATTVIISNHSEGPIVARL